jgi:hypothetical protein
VWKGATAAAIAVVAGGLLAPGGAAAAPSFSDGFEGGVSGSVWQTWSTNANDNLLTGSTSHNITPAGNQSARANASDPAFWTAVHDFGATAGSVVASVWVYEDFSNDGTNGAQPITAMLSLYGDSGATPGTGSDYLQLGVVPFYPSGSTGWGVRTRSGDQGGGHGILDTNLDRVAGWTHLRIEADALADGGQVRFYMDLPDPGPEQLVGTSQRMAGQNLRWVRLGNNSKTYENFWYDDVSVVPEPASAALLGLGAAAALLPRRRRRA